VFVRESIFRIMGTKIVLQHNRGEADAGRQVSLTDLGRKWTQSGHSSYSAANRPGAFAWDDILRRTISM